MSVYFLEEALSMCLYLMGSPVHMATWSTHPMAVSGTHTAVIATSILTELCLYGGGPLAHHSTTSSQVSLINNNKDSINNTTALLNIRINSYFLILIPILLLILIPSPLPSSSLVSCIFMCVTNGEPPRPFKAFFCVAYNGQFNKQLKSQIVVKVKLF